MKSNYKTLGKYIKEVKNRNTDGKISTLLGVNIDKYFMPSVANIVGTDLTKYKVVKKGQFACNRMHVGRDKRLPVALSDSEEDFLVSPAYDVFEIKDENILTPEYLMMWFSRKEFDRNAWFYTDADVRGGLHWKAFCAMKLPVPSLEKQKEIVEEYNIIVNRIKLNEQLNRKLEETAQAIYKQWFVDFKFPDENGNPYKSSGGEMEYQADLDMEIPNNWQLKELEGCIKFSNGKTRPKNSGSYPVYGGNGIMDFADRFNAENVIIIGRVGENCGNVFYENQKCWVSDNAICGTCNEDSFLFFFHTLKAMQLNNSTEGTGQPLLTQDILYRKQVLLPTEKVILRHFEETISKVRKHLLLSQTDIVFCNELKTNVLGKMAK